MLELTNKQNKNELTKLIRETPQKNESEILTYLKQGVLFLAYPGIMTDIFADNTETIGHGHIYTDGKYAWLDVFLIILNDYCNLDKDFLNHMQNNKWFIDSKAIDLNSLEVESFIKCDEEYEEYFEKLLYESKK